ncbi:XdhC family protein [Sulfidibacter corallicola]|uniref:XdhC family protein n=1 Tax=Sulfidibacter corallicola TaxID=2818388 RepID=A0A8A4TUM7_SULCO|nr:XdhC/CoxI family protein [Sulfidibacter corallicola]QTD52838.1 XdhC family protein [Sulfidibacter corallicola]
MKDTQLLQNGLARYRREGLEVVMATVVEVDGPAYRGPGARLLVGSDGSTVGAISGGCLESDIREHALAIMESGNTRLVTYDASGDEELLWGLGTGCGGLIRVFLEHWPQDLDDWLKDQTMPAAMLTVYESTEEPRIQPGYRLSLSHTGNLKEHGQAPGEWRDRLVDLLRNRIPSETSLVSQSSLATSFQLTSPANLHLLMEPIPLPVELLVVGAGFDALPLLETAHELGWHTTAIDHRPAFLAPERFPPGCRLVEAEPEVFQSDRPNEPQAPPHWLLKANTMAVIMTHHFEHDRAWLRLLLQSEAPYVGTLGPRNRTERLLQALTEEGFTPQASMLDRLYSPVGLDLGGETPREVALSIVAEIQAVLSGRTGGFLRERKGSIHNRHRSHQTLAPDSDE